MTEKKEKQLKLKDIQSKSKELTKREKFYLDKEKQQFIYYYPKFSKKKTFELFVDLKETIDHVGKNNLTFPSNDLEIIQYTQFLIIKHFTSLQTELKNKSYEVHVETMYKLMETGLFAKFIDEMFDKSEVYDLLDELDKISEVGVEMLNMEMEQKGELAEKLKSNFLKKVDE